MRALLALLEALRARGSRALIFSQFTAVLDLLEEVLRAARVRHLRIDGGTPAAARQGLVDRFGADGGIAAFLLSTRAGGMGINLVAADTVIFFDHDFNPQNDAQAEDRAYRIGQTRPVHVYHLLTAGTVDAHMSGIAAGKRDMAVALMAMSER